MFTFFKDKVDGLLKPRIKIKFAKDKEPSPFERSIEKVFIYGKTRNAIRGVLFKL